MTSDVSPAAARRRVPLRRRPRARRRTAPATPATSSPASTGSIANAQPLQPPGHQPVARPPGDRAVRDRSAVPRRRPRGRRPASSSSPRPATTDATATGAPVLGGITSPGNSPFAITVGALDIARHRSIARRRPRRRLQLARTDAVRLRGEAGRRRAGHRASSRSTAPNSWLEHELPATGTSRGSGQNSYLRLSGTSMSAAVVSGGVALLLDAESRLSPAQVKVALQIRRALPAPRRADRRRRRQRQLSGRAAARARRPRRLDR